MPDSDPLAEAEEFLEEAKRWCDEPTPDGSERLAAQIEAVEAATERLRREMTGYRLACVECGETSEGGARGWRALLTVDDQVATYCPECARKEFDGS